MLIRARDLERACRRLWDRQSQLVGWGTGSVFEYFQRHWPVRLDALVDSDSARWGHKRGPLTIESPEVLRRYSPSDTLVLIYSGFWPDIQRAARGLGPFTAIPASAAFADVDTRERLAKADAAVDDLPVDRARRSADAIVVQGPVIPDVTTHVLRVLTAVHPNDLLVLSTWDDTDAGLLADAARWADDVVTSTRPEPEGVQHRNCQIVSTAAGIERAIAHGARTVLKTRTDLAVLQPAVFDQARWWWARIGHQAARQAGLARRIIVPSSFTRKYLLYHPSDLVMLGDARDLQAYWSAPLDSRSGDLLSPEWIDRPLAEVNMAGHPAESYLGLAFNRTIGREVSGTLQDSWAFYRDLFAVVDNDWFDLLWYKNLSVPDVAVWDDVRELVRQPFWQRLDAGAVDAPPRGSLVAVAASTLRSLSAVRE